MTTQDSAARVADITKKNSTSATKRLIVLAIILLVGLSLFWVYYTHSNANRVFWGMVDNNLKTASVARVIQQSDGQQTLEQVVEVQTSPNHLVNSRSIIMQGTATRVVTESIGTPTQDFVRYTDIQTTQKSASGSDLDFSKVKNIWGKTEPRKAADGSVTTNGQLYNELALSMIPIASLDANQRAKLIGQMQKNNVYKFAAVKGPKESFLKKVFKRSATTFSVEINPQQYVSVLKAFAAETGLNHLAALNPEDYKSATPIAVAMDVDNWTYQLKAVQYTKTGRVEVLQGYNSNKQLNKPPKDAISVNELQTRLQAVQ